MLMTINQAADYLGYSVSGLRKLVNRGIIRYFQATEGAALKFKREWLDDFIEANTKPSEQKESAKRRSPKFDPSVWT